MKRIVSLFTAIMLCCTSFVLPADAENENLVNNPNFDEALTNSGWNFTDVGIWYRSGSSDYLMYVPTSKKSTAQVMGPDWNLLSYDIEATVSSTYNAEVNPISTGGEMMPAFTITPQKAFDENMRTWWSAETGKAGEWIMGDMGKVKNVNAIQLNFYEQDTNYLGMSAREYTGCYCYLLEYSLDGESWITIADRSNYISKPYKVQDTSHDYFELIESTPMRYIRLTNMGDVPAGGKFTVSGLRLFGDGDGNAPEVVYDFIVKRPDNEDGRSILITWEEVPGAEG